MSIVLFILLQSVGMRPLERSLEKLDDVRRKKLSEMISGSDDAVPGGTSTGLYIFITGKEMLLGRGKGKRGQYY